jgi:hypothetical protein
LGQKKQRAEGIDARVIKDCLELGGGFCAILKLQIGKAANVKGEGSAGAMPFPNAYLRVGSRRVMASADLFWMFAEECPKDIRC